jgi:tRNA 5-methylaminomethyl-2-thiouridine biosynthesis bifunctional protein
VADHLATHSLASCGLPGAWARHPAWTVLDTDFQDGRRFLSTWLAWRHDPQRPRLLHYVGIAPAATAAPADVHPNDEWGTLAHALAAQCTGLGPGFHRIQLDGGHVSLTLCHGDTQAMLGEQVFQADTVWGGTPQDKWAAQLLARRCKRGTRFALHPAAPAAPTTAHRAPLAVLLQGAGFQTDPPSPDADGMVDAFTGTFEPRWDIPSRRTPRSHAVQPPTRCAVIGAGMAGASVAQALALRGWQVTVFDQDAAPASGASGVPVGLAVPHVSADDNPRSRLSRSGTRLLLQHAQRLLARGQEWDPSGVLERRRNAAPHWHPQAAWIKPATLVQAWLAQPGITFVGNAKVAGLHRADDTLWLLQDPQDRELGRFAVVVLANALGCATLLKNGAPADALPGPELQDKLAALQAVHGTLSHGTYAEDIPGLPATPVNGHGCFIPHVPGAGGEQWVAGSTFETDALAAADLWAQHAANMARLQHLLPEGGAELAETLDRGPVAQWSATRCVTHDRLPLVGPIDTPTGSGLWLCVGMGSRGLSFTALCAELLAARLGAEPLPVEHSLSRSLDANRVRRLRPAAAKPAPAVD